MGPATGETTSPTRGGKTGAEVQATSADDDGYGDGLAEEGMDDDA